MTNLFKVTFLFIAISLIITRSAYAYLDPGTGSIILQALAAGVLALGVGWRWIINFFKNLGKKKS